MAGDKQRKEGAVLANGCVWRDPHVAPIYKPFKQVRIMNKVFTMYQTDVPNILGGFMTYNKLSDAFRACENNRDAHTITAVTCVKSEWWNGKSTGYLCEILSQGVIYRKKGGMA